MHLLCNAVIPSEDTKTLEIIICQKSEKAPPITNVDLECLIEKIDGCKKILKIYPQQKQVITFYQVFQMSTIFCCRSVMQIEVNI